MSESPQKSGAMEGARQEPAARLFHPVDTVLAVGLIAVCAFLWYETTQFEEVSALLQGNLGPAVFPRILLVTIVLFSVVLPFEHIFLIRQGKNIDKDRSQSVMPITWATIALLLGVMVASQALGTFLTMVSVCLLLPMLWGERRLRFVLPFAIIFPLTVTLVFNVLLGVFFEPGIFDIKFIG